LFKLREISPRRLQMAAPSAILIIFSLLSLITPAIGAAARFAGVENAAILPFGGAGVAPRWYAEGIPATPAQPLSRNPGRVILGWDGEEEKEGLWARDVIQCPAGNHSCVELGPLGAQKCCSNDRYCYLTGNSEPKCCSIGVKCPDSPCNSDQRFCNNTIPITVSDGPDATGLPTGTNSGGGGQETNLTSHAIFTTVTGCCNRQCGTSSFQCEGVFGGQCCPNGNKCGESSLCIVNTPASTSSSVSTIVSEIPAGCTAASQFRCSETDGGGCCDTGSVCTFQSVAPATSTPVCSPDPNYADGDSSSGALSSGARVGIGVGVALGAAVVIAAITWFCIYQRKKGRAGKSNGSAHEMRENGVGPSAGPTGQGGAGGGGGRRRGGVGLGLAGRWGKARSSLMPAAAATPGPGRSNLSEASGPTISSARPPLHDHGRVYSYFGPTAIAGPFTQRDEDEGAVYNEADSLMATAATTPPTGGPLPRESTSPFAAPGSMPYYHPDHILRPVEIGDSNDAQKATQKEGERGNAEPVEVESPTHEGATTGMVYELMGSLGPTSPLNPGGDTSHSTDKGQSPEPPESGAK
jgi:hypothetical protein